MTEKDKTPAARKPSRAAQTEHNQTEQTFTQAQVQQMIAKALEDFKAQLPAAPVMAVTPAEERVVLRFQAEVNDENEVDLGAYGRIHGKRANISVSRSDFFGTFRSATVQRLLANRELLVISGLTDEERRMYGVDYAEGECLDPAVYDRLISMGKDLEAIYPKLCRGYKEMMACKFAQAYENHTLEVPRDVLLTLNALSRKDHADLPKDDPRRKGDFWPIISKMNLAEEQTEEA